jgi:hypothetical protein
MPAQTSTAAVVVSAVDAQQLEHVCTRHAHCAQTKCIQMYSLKPCILRGGQQSCAHVHFFKEMHMQICQGISQFVMQGMRTALHMRCKVLIKR